MKLGVVNQAGWLGTFVLLNLACSGAPDDMETSPETSQTTSALIYPAQITGTAAPSANNGQAETQVAFSYASASDTVMFVSYNDKSNVDGIDTNTQGLFGWAYNDPFHSSGWVVHKKAPPAGFDLVWGDPGIVVNPFSSNRYTYISNMGSTTGSADLDSLCVARFGCSSRSADGKQSEIDRLRDVS